MEFGFGGVKLLDVGRVYDEPKKGHQVKLNRQLQDDLGLTRSRSLLGNICGAQPPPETRPHALHAL